MHARSIPKIQGEGLLAGHCCTQNRCLNVKMKRLLVQKIFLDTEGITTGHLWIKHYTISLNSWLLQLHYMLPIVLEVLLFLIYSRKSTSFSQCHKLSSPAAEVSTSENNWHYYSTIFMPFWFLGPRTPTSLRRCWSTFDLPKQPIQEEHAVAVPFTAHTPTSKGNLHTVASSSSSRWRSRIPAPQTPSRSTSQCGKSLGHASGQLWCVTPCLYQ